jgi:hypothetical protein
MQIGGLYVDKAKNHLTVALGSHSIPLRAICTMTKNSNVFKSDYDAFPIKRPLTRISLILRVGQNSAICSQQGRRWSGNIPI